MATGTLLFGAVLYFSYPDAAPRTRASSETEENSFDFGSISMAAGKVTHTFELKNEASSPLLVKRLYTSCMCTEATLRTDTTEVGPFGMPGHGFTPGINISIPEGKSGSIKVVFDPAAHGPAGVGSIERMVYLESDKGTSIFRFHAIVTP